MRKAYVFMMLLLALGMGLKSCSCNNDQNDAQELEDLKVKLAGERKAREIVDGWVKDLHVSKDAWESIYYIDSNFWSTKTYQEKEMVVKTLVLYDESKNVGEAQSVVLKDKMTGKKLASFTDLGGLDIIAE